MKNSIVKILSVKNITPDVLRITTEKPTHYAFKPGQAVGIGMNKSGWKTKMRPFTFTSLPSNDYLEFTIKTYPEHKGFTNELLKLRVDDELIVHEPFGAIQYRGQGVFIAGGAGITPFISILRSLQENYEIGENRLIFANKTAADIICNEELSGLLGINFINILSEEQHEGYFHGLISENFLKDHMNGSRANVYLCGPPPMMTEVELQLGNLGISKRAITKEAF